MAESLRRKRSHRPYEKKPKKNLRLRAYIASTGVSYKDIADYIHIQASTLSMWMSYELSPDREQEIRQAVKALVLLGGKS